MLWVKIAYCSVSEKTVLPSAVREKGRLEWLP